MCHYAILMVCVACSGPREAMDKRDSRNNQEKEDPYRCQRKMDRERNNQN